MGNPIKRTSNYGLVVSNHDFWMKIPRRNHTTNSSYTHVLKHFSFNDFSVQGRSVLLCPCQCELWLAGTLTLCGAENKSHIGQRHQLQQLLVHYCGPEPQFYQPHLKAAFHSHTLALSLCPAYSVSPMSACLWLKPRRNFHVALGLNISIWYLKKKNIVDCFLVMKALLTSLVH